MIESIKAEKLAWSAIAEAQPDSLIPIWLLKNTTSAKNKINDNIWEVKIYIFKKRKLGLGESWETRPDGSKILVLTDPVDCKKYYRIHYIEDEDARVYLFQVQVDIVSNHGLIIRSVILGDINKDDFELYYE